MNLRDIFLSKNFGPQGSGGSGVTIKNQDKTITENGTYTADAGYTGLGTVSVNVETSGGGGYTIEDIASENAITGDLVIDFKITRSYAFYGLTAIGKVTLGKGFAGSYNTGKMGFFGSSSVTEVYCVPGVNTYLGYNGMFSNCVSLTKAVLNEFTTSNSTFSGCTNLKCVDISASIASNDNTFKDCKNLKILILRHSSVVTSNAPTYWAFWLMNTPFDDNPAGSGGFCLVPSALVSEYQAATNWSVLYEAGTCTFLALEEYTVDGTTTGEIDWDKLNAVVYPE